MYKVIHGEITEIETTLNTYEKDGYELYETVMSGNTGMCRLILKKKPDEKIFVQRNSGITVEGLKSIETRCVPPIIFILLGCFVLTLLSLIIHNWK